MTRASEMTVKTALTSTQLVTCCLEGRFRQGLNLHMPRLAGVRAVPWMTAGDRRFPPVLARMWHATWMQTIGATLLATKRRCLVRVLMAIHDGRSAYGLLYFVTVWNHHHHLICGLVARLAG